MKILLDYGLENPCIKSMKITTADGKRENDEFRLYCDNYMKNNLLAKKFSFFEQQFNSFLIENHSLLYEKLKHIILPEEGKKEDDDATEIILTFIEEEFNNYLTKNEKIWEKEYIEKIKITYSFKWLKANSPTSILPNLADVKNKCLFLCLIPKSLQNYITRGSKEIETRAINILYKEKIHFSVPNIYYRYIDETTVTKGDFHTKVKEHLNLNNAVIYIVSTMPSQKNQKQNVYLYNFLLDSKTKEG